MLVLGLLVSLQTIGLGEGHSADVAAVRPFACVGTHVAL